MPLEPRTDPHHDAFVRRFGHVFEHASWVAERAWDLQPGGTLETLHAAFLRVLDEAGPEKRLALLRAHPRLADKLAVQEGLTPDSATEQASAGLDRLSDEELAMFLDLNERYEARFGFPFIICARLHSKTTIVGALRARLNADPEAEMAEALAQVAQISRLRLEDALRESPPPGFDVT
jgi:2-oxo-4-hydroxy-4-carboxy-5-ureidoimidazoline decarboxylase